jgi:hypothetical protein
MEQPKEVFSEEKSEKSCKEKIGNVCIGHTHQEIDETFSRIFVILKNLTVPEPNECMNA